MVKFLISVATAASALAIAAPASAQFYGGGYGYNNNGYNSGYGYNDRGYKNYDYRYGNRRAGYESRRLIASNQQRLAQLHRDIRNYVVEGRLDPREAAQLDREVDRFGQELYAVARDGMTGEEGVIYDRRADRLAREIKARAGVGYGYGYRYGDGYGDGHRRW